MRFNLLQHTTRIVHQNQSQTNRIFVWNITFRRRHQASSHNGIIKRFTNDFANSVVIRFVYMSKIATSVCSVCMSGILMDIENEIKLQKIKFTCGWLIVKWSYSRAVRLHLLALIKYEEQYKLLFSIRSSFVVCKNMPFGPNSRIFFPRIFMIRNFTFFFSSLEYLPFCQSEVPLPIIVHIVSFNIWLIWLKQCTVEMTLAPHSIRASAILSTTLECKSYFFLRLKRT